MSFYPIMIQEHLGLKVVRGDLYPGGLKCRVLTEMLQEDVAEKEIVYAGCYFGHSSFALGVAGLLTGKKITVFLPAPVRETYIHRLAQSMNNVRCIIANNSHQDEVQGAAHYYAEAKGARLLPIGFNFGPFTDRYIKIIRNLCPAPPEAWLTGGSGVTARCMQSAWPTTMINVIDLNIRSNSDFGAPNKVWKIPEKLSDEATILPPWPAAIYYDAKAWRVIKENAQPGALVWSIA